MANAANLEHLTNLEHVIKTLTEFGFKPNKSSRQKQVNLDQTNLDLVSYVFLSDRVDIFIDFAINKDEIFCANIWMHYDSLGNKLSIENNFVSIDNKLFDKHVDTILYNIMLYVMQ